MAEYEDAQRTSSDWIISGGILYHKSTTKKNRVCSEIYCVESTKDIIIEKPNYCVVYKAPERGNDCKGQYHIIEFQRALRHASGKELFSPFEEAGVITYNPALFKQYLDDSFENSRVVTTIRHVGWINARCTSFNIGNEILGNSPQEYNILTSNNKGFHRKGTLQEWQQSIGKYVQANSNLLFALGVSLLSPLYKLLNLDYTSCVYHFHGSSSIGKTTTVGVANSVWGDATLIQDWNMTKNSAEEVLSSRSGIGVCFDEIGTEGEKAQLDCLVYIISRDRGARRMTKDMIAKEIKQWKLACVSTGEESLFTYLSAQGKERTKGHMSRFIDIPFQIMNGTQQTGFEESLDIETHGSLSDHLRDACSQQYGSVGRAYISYCINNRKEVEEIAKECKSIIQELQDKQAASVSGIRSRIRKRFYIIMLPLLIAARAGIIDMAMDEIISSIELMIDRYELASEGGALVSMKVDLCSALYKAVQQYEDDGALRLARVDKAAGKPWVKLSNSQHCYRLVHTRNKPDGTVAESIEYYFLGTWVQDKLRPIAKEYNYGNGASGKGKVNKALGVGEGCILTTTQKKINGENFYGINYSLLQTIVCGWSKSDA